VNELPEDFRDLLLELADVGAEFVLVGGHAVAFHGHPRATKNMDVLIRANTNNAERAIARRTARRRCIAVDASPPCSEGVRAPIEEHIQGSRQRGPASDRGPRDPVAADGTPPPGFGSGFANETRGAERTHLKTKKKRSRRGWQPIWGGNELNSKGLFRSTNTDIPIDTPANLSLSVAFSGPRKRWQSSDGRTSLLSCLQGFSFAVELVRAPKLSRIQLSCMCPSSCIEPPWQAPYDVAAAPAGRTSS
jgi:hypothetical protein